MEETPNVNVPALASSTDTTLIIVQGVAMAIGFSVMAIINGKQAYTGLMTKFGK